jgi:hypothetical protein
MLGLVNHLARRDRLTVESGLGMTASLRRCRNRLVVRLWVAQHGRAGSRQRHALGMRFGMGAQARGALPNRHLRSEAEPFRALVDAAPVGGLDVGKRSVPLGVSHSPGTVGTAPRGWCAARTRSGTPCRSGADFDFRPHRPICTNTLTLAGRSGRTRPIALGVRPTGSVQEPGRACGEAGGGEGLG